MMSGIYDPRYNLGAFGLFNRNKSFVTLEAGTDAWFLENEANEMQWLQADARAEQIRNQYYSGVYKSNDYLKSAAYLYDDNSMLNAFTFGNMQVNINGYMINIAGAGGKDVNYNYIALDEPPETGTYYDLVYIEAYFKEVKGNSDLWYNGNENNANGTIENDLIDNRIKAETCRRIQLQWKLHSARITYENQLFDDSIVASQVFAYGGRKNKSIYGFVNAEQVDIDDKGLWIAGAADADLQTADGFVYAIPLFKVIRRNTASYTEDNKNGSVNYVFGENNNSGRSDGKFANIIYEDDIIDVRNFIVKPDMHGLLNKSFENVLQGKVNNKPILYTTFFGIDKCYTDLRTAMYNTCNLIDESNNLITGEYEYIPGVEQEALKLIGYNSYFHYTGNLPKEEITVQMMVLPANKSNIDLCQIYNENENLSMYFENRTISVSFGSDIKLQYTIPIETFRNKFIHIGLLWSTERQLMYLKVNNNEVAHATITDGLFTNNITAVDFGRSIKMYGADDTAFDELEISREFKYYFNQIPASVSAGTADICIDAQKGRSNYASYHRTVPITLHVSNRSNRFGELQFTINAPTSGTFADNTPKLYFDNESTTVEDVEWTKQTDSVWKCYVNGLGNNIVYNMIVIADVNYPDDQGLKNIMYKGHLITCEKYDKPFYTVEYDKESENHIIDAIGENDTYNLNNQCIVFNQNIKKTGFGAGLIYYVNVDNTNTISISNENVTAVYSAEFEGTNVLKSFTKDDDTLEIRLIDVISGTVKLILATNFPSAIYSSKRRSIEELLQIEYNREYGDGATREFTYRSETQIFDILQNKNGDNFVYVDGKPEPVSITVDGTFVHIHFELPPKNKANIDMYILSEYTPLKSERVAFTYELQNIEYQNIDSIDSSAVVYSDKLYAITQSYDDAHELSAMSLPMMNEEDEINLYSDNLGIAEHSTILALPVNGCAKADECATDAIDVLLTQDADYAYRGYSNCSVSNKSIYSLHKFDNNVNHINVLPMIINVDHSLKLAILSEHRNDNLNMITSSCATNVYDLDKHYLIKNL